MRTTSGAGARPGSDRLDRGRDELLVDGDLELHLLEQVARLLVAAVDLGDSLLAPAPEHLGDGHEVDLLLLELRQHVLHPVRLDDRDDVFHFSFLPLDGDSCSLFSNGSRQPD